MRRLLTLACLAALAGPAAAKPPKPTIEVRARSVNEVVGLAGYVAGLADQAEAGKQLVGAVKAMADPDTGIAGVDPSKPFGFYAALTEDVVGSPAALLIPVKDEAAFLDTVRDKLNVPATEEKGKVYKLAVPNVPLPVYMAVRDGYAYVTAVTPGALADDARIAPADFFGKADPAAPVVAAVVHLDRVPDALVKGAVANAELKMKDADKEDRPGETPAQKLARQFGQAQALAALNALAAGGKALTLTLTVDPKADDIALNLDVTAKPGTPFAAFAASLAARPGLAVPAAEDPILEARLNVALPPEALKAWKPVADAILDEAIKTGPAKDEVGRRLVLDAFRPTLKAGVIDQSTTLAGKPGKLATVSVLGVTDGGRIESAAKVVAPFLADGGIKTAFDAAKAGGVSLHKLTVPPAAEAFGTDTVWLGTSADRLVLSAGPAEGGAKAAATEAPAPGPAVDVSVSLARLVPLTDPANADKAKEAAAGVFGDKKPAGRDALTFRVAGGDRLSATLRVKGQGVRFLGAFDKLKKAQ